MHGALLQTIEELRAENERAHSMLLELHAAVKPSVLRRETRRLEHERAVEALDERIESLYHHWLSFSRRKEVSLFCREFGHTFFLAHPLSP